MANYYSTFRTNYFKVKDVELFKTVMENAKKYSEDIVYYENGPRFMIGGSDFASLPVEDLAETPEGQKLMAELGFDPENCDRDDIFFEALQKCVAEDDAIIFKEGGHEKLRYVTLIGMVITSKHIKSLDIDDLLLLTARTLLENEKWETKLEY